MKYSDRVKEAITETNKELIISMPRPLFKRFKRWAYANANDCWWLAIDKLLSQAETQQDFDTQVRMLSDRDDFIMKELARVELMIPTEVQSEQAEVKHFGKKGE